MECNRDDAIKAKALAERGMENKDFTSARRFASKAQQLYPNLEDISKIMLVCDVLCSEKKIVFGKEENDWYAILKIAPTADEATIRKQYRKFVLTLHPDKNSFPGASEAFHLVNEAHRILLDRKLRMLYDMKLQAANSLVKTPSARHSQQKENPTQYPREQTANEKVAPQCTNQKDRQDHQSADNRKNPQEQTVDEKVAPQCTNQQDRQDHQSADTGGSGHRSHKNAEPTQNPQEEAVNEKVAPQCTNQEDRHDHHSVDTRKTFWTVCNCCQAKFKYYEEVMGKQLNCRVCKAFFTALQTNPPFQSDPLSQGAAGSLDPKVAVQRDDDNKKKSESDDGVTCNASKDLNAEGNTSNTESKFEKMGTAQEDSCPKTAFHEEGEDNHLETNKRHIPPFNESSDAEIRTSDAKSTMEGTTNFGKLNSKTQKKRQRTESISDFKGNSCENDNDAKKAFQDNLHPVPDDVESYEYPTPDFSNFDDLRVQSVFREGQIWALYDTLDAMPRFYALIKEVFSPKFKVQLIWLEPDPDDEEEKKWKEKGLPVSCGKFRYGNSDVLQELQMFSHQVYCEKGIIPADPFEVHPRKGETWALFKDWDISWQTSKKYEYEFVEVLSGYSNGFGVYVTFLSKVEGLSCIFTRETKGTKKFFLIPPKERFRFSHRVPSFKMTDEENKGVIAGSFELDPASLPFDSELEFHNFEENVRPNKFQIGQIWAIYCDEDSLPRYYCKIERIGPSPTFNLHVRWFAACPSPEGIISWIDDAMLTSVGKFKLMNGRPEKYSNTDPFSHLVRAEATDGKDVYSIFPEKGQIWALYKNWSHSFNLSNLLDCEYEIVEVVGENDDSLLVSIMKPVKGFKSVFRPRVEEQISKTEILRFSHQIPAFQLTKELGGRLRGCWELDAAALPHHLLNK